MSASQPVAEVRRNTAGGMAYIVPLVPPEQLTHGMKLYDKPGYSVSNIDNDKLLTYAYAEGRKDEREAGLTLDERYWLENRASIVEAIGSAGFRLMSNKNGFWLLNIQDEPS